MPVNEREQIGMMVAGMGLFFVAFGVSMMFDRSLLAGGNVLFISGVVIAIGMRKTTDFFFHQGNAVGSMFLLGGIVMVLVQWAIIGLLIESVGFVLLFK